MPYGLGPPRYVGQVSTRERCHPDDHSILPSRCPVDYTFRPRGRPRRGRAEPASAVLSPPGAHPAIPLHASTDPRCRAPRPEASMYGKPLHRLSPDEGEDLSMGSTPDFGRRDLIKRSAALGLITVPAMSVLSACASGGDDDTKKVDKGEKSAKNPLAVNASAPLDVVIFDGGFGQKYAKDAEAEYAKAYPKTKGKIKHAATQKIQTVLQPRFNGGTPPDLVDNSGAEQMDFGTLV